MNTLAITFAAWNAWEQVPDNTELWNHFGDRQGNESPIMLPKAQRIPTMLRRRLGSHGKLAMAAAESAIAATPKSMPTVFSSQHGDLARTLELLDSLTSNEPLSPTHFSLSVHNAIAGIYSIARNDNSPTTALSSFVDDVSSALLETQLILEEQQCEFALCIVHDEPLPELYSTQSIPKRPYATAFLLSAKPSMSSKTLELSISPDDSPKSTSTPIERPTAVELVEFLNQEKRPSLHLSSPERTWLWQIDNNGVSRENAQ